MKNKLYIALHSLVILCLSLWISTAFPSGISERDISEGNEIELVEEVLELESQKGHWNPTHSEYSGGHSNNSLSIIYRSHYSNSGWPFLLHKYLFQHFLNGKRTHFYIQFSSLLVYD